MVGCDGVGTVSLAGITESLVGVKRYPNRPTFAVHALHLYLVRFVHSLNLKCTLFFFREDGDVFLVRDSNKTTVMGISKFVKLTYNTDLWYSEDNMITCLQKLCHRNKTLRHSRVVHTSYTSAREWEKVCCARMCHDLHP